jgi:hypothetical protein
MCLSFKRPPGPEYLNNFWKHIRTTTKNDELDIIIKAIPMEFKTFPSIEEINQLINKIRSNQRAQKKLVNVPVTPNSWVSIQAPGTPPKWEAVFLWIKRGMTETNVFKRALKGLNVSEDQVWEAYESWQSGAIHALVAEKSKQ